MRNGFKASFGPFPKRSAYNVIAVIFATMEAEETIYIKNMVCNRCIMAVEQLLAKMQISYQKVVLGEARLLHPLSEGGRHSLRQALSNLGFELIDNKKSQIIEKIKNVIIDLVHNKNFESRNNVSDILSEALQLEYNYLSNLFSEVEGTTIEKYLIAQKIERVKELLVYNELSLSEIAFELNYSSVAYLSNQFKKVTGLTPGHFRKIGRDKRKPLDEV